LQSAELAVQSARQGKVTDAGVAELKKALPQLKVLGQ